MVKLVTTGRYAGWTFFVMENEHTRQRSILLDHDMEVQLRSAGVDLTPLEDIGTKDGKEAIRDLLDTAGCQIDRL